MNLLQTWCPPQQHAVTDSCAICLCACAVSPAQAAAECGQRRGLEPATGCCRYELERQLLDGKVTVSELPSLWNKRMTEYLGCTPANDAEGILQVRDCSVGAMP